MRPHIPKVDTGDDYDFMCGTSAFGATVATRDVCQSCVKRTLEIVDLLAQACDELKAIAREDAHLPAARRRAKLLRRIDKALGKRPAVEPAKAAACRFGRAMCSRCTNPGCGMDL